MKYLFKTMLVINKLDHWTKLYSKFKIQREKNPWYPVPVLENPTQVLKELENSDVARGLI